jgi:UDP-N-acetyl-D-mannosaminuronic acid dehydrogenase
MPKSFEYDICTIGGCGHVGLPLSIMFASKGKKVCIYDINEEWISLVSKGIMPFKEEGAEEILKSVLKSGNLTLSKDPQVISKSENVIIVIGTPVDEFLNPRLSEIKKFFDFYIDYFTEGQLIILRSTIYPGTTEHIHKWVKGANKNLDLAFCPERIAEGFAVIELEKLPQIVSSFTDSGIKRAKELFNSLTNDIIELEPKEAELAKLFTNVWRYLKFAVANQFFMIANDHGLDYYKIHKAITHNYPRAKDLPSSGFAAGPCLFKDTMQLAAFHENNFYLGHSAMLINEGLPNYLVQSLKAKIDLSGKTVGILGMAFKGGSDDKRSSLSYKLKKILEFECKEVLCTDPYIKETYFLKLDEVINESDILILATPHDEYKNINFNNKTIIDIWNFYGKGGLI